DPTKRLTGKVTSVANVGEQRPNADAKVFEVKVQVEQSDSTLRPGMTTGNAIETLKVADALFVPLEALGSEGGVSFVYTQARLRAELGPQAIFTFRTAVEALQHNKLRAFLTSLGILFGVASVIAMLAIGKGAEREILEQLRLLGSNNLLITPLVQQKEGPIEERSEKEVKKFSPGLTYADAEAIARVIPAV